MFDTAFFEHLIHTNYAADIRSLHPFPSSCVPDVRAVCQVVLRDGSSWTMRVGKSDVPVPDWLVGCGTTATPDWFASRAATLQYLEHHRYPAPRVIMTRAGTVVGAAHEWCTFATTFVEGQVIDPTPPHLYAMAAALGRLHQLPLDTLQPTMPQPGQSWWFPNVAIPAAVAQYATLRNALPHQWETTVDVFCQVLQTVQQRDLPRAVIHGDGWAGNAVHTDDQRMVWIDWEPSGRGIAILDVGRLLLHAHQTLAAPTALPNHLSSASIAAVIDGYYSARLPTPTERAVLLEAIRFSIAFSAAGNFIHAQQAGWNEQSVAKLKRRQQWYDLSEAIADMAQQRLNERW